MYEIMKHCLLDAIQVWCYGRTYYFFDMPIRSFMIGRSSRLSMPWVPRQQKFRAMNGAHLASPIRGELGYAHWPQLGSQIHCPIGNQIWGPLGKKMFALTLP